MKRFTTSIIPVEQTFARVNDNHKPNYEAICIFAAIGFFLDQDTYWKDEIALNPGTNYVIDHNSFVVKSERNFNWQYNPRNISFKTAVDEFTDLFETIVEEQSNKKRVLLPLSGGLDSRTQATALKQLGADVHSYSYSFKNGFKEHAIGKMIAEVCDFKFNPFLIAPNYLWDVIEEMAAINGCYSEFTHPRQMAVVDDFKMMHGEFSLGHWGDVLFDRGFELKDEKLSELEIIFKKVIKRGGLEVASKLWQAWHLEGDFETYLKQRIQDLLDKIDIADKSAKIRAFKSLYWAPRWTSVSLSFFAHAHPVNLPYYDDRICKFICGIPERYLADRKIQIEYIKNRNPKLAKIKWQDHMPFNLYNYQNPNFINKFSYRLKHKVQREVSSFFGKKYVQRNWEQQFLGPANSNQLESYLFAPDFMKFLEYDVVSELYDKFKNKDSVFYSHAVSMLLTISLWYNKAKHDIFFKF